MNKKTHIVLGVIVSCFSLLCAADEQPVVPDGVRYKAATPEVNEQAKHKLQKLFSGKAAADEVLALFEEKVLICGPGLWEELKNDPAVAKVAGGEVTFQVPQLDATGKTIRTREFEGKLFQDAAGVTAFWKAFVQTTDLSDLKIRKLTTPELSILWAMISFDITEPLFIAENAHHKILFVFTSAEKPRVCWIDDFQNLSLKHDPEPNRRAKPVGK